MQTDAIIQREIENMLRQKIGLDPDAVGTRSIFRAVKKGMRMGKMQGLSDYLAGLKASPAVFEALIESVVVPETSFFRNRASFVFLRQWISHEWQAQRPLRVLSLPCSTGEEPYSIAITLLEEGLDLDEFQIDAVDISTLALEKAKQGIYSPYAFRRQTYRHDDRYFTLATPEGVTQGRRITQRYYLTEKVRTKVCFWQGNVLDADLLNGQAPYDIVFCRNLLIYFDQAARDLTLGNLAKCLRPDGLLFLGYAETSMVDLQQYQAVPYPQTFAYRKRSPTLRTSRNKETDSSAMLSNSVIKMPARATLAHNREHRAIKNNAAPALAAAAVVSTPPDAASLAAATKPRPGNQCAANAVETLQGAQQLADSGDIAASIAACDRYLAAHPTEAAVHLLRGELYQAEGDDAAAEACFEKAIYLNPQLEEALTHLLLLKEEQQDDSGAALLRARLERLSQ